MSSLALRLPRTFPKGIKAVVSQPSDDTTNVAELARQAMARHPARPAFILPGAGPITFADVGALVDRFAEGLAALNLRPQSRVLVLTRPTSEIYALALAVLRTGH